MASRILDLTGPQQQPSPLGHANELGLPDILDSGLELTSLLTPSNASVCPTAPATAFPSGALAAATTGPITACRTDTLPANPTTPSFRSSVVAATSKILSSFLKLRHRHTSAGKSALSAASVAASVTDVPGLSQGPFRRSTSAGDAGTSLCSPAAPTSLADRQYSKSISCPGDSARRPTTAPADTPTAATATPTTTGNVTCEERPTPVLGGTDVELAIEALQLACRVHECLWGHGEDIPSCSSSTWPTTTSTNSSSSSSSSSSLPYNDCYTSDANSCSSYGEDSGALWGGGEDEHPHDPTALYQRAMEAACCVSHPLLAMLVREAVHCYVHPEYGNPEAVLRQILQLATGKTDGAEVSHVPTVVSVAEAVPSAAEAQEWVAEGALEGGHGGDGGWSFGSCRPAAASGAWVRRLGGVGCSGRYERVDVAELAREGPKGVARGGGFVVDDSGDSAPAAGGWLGR